MRLLYEIKGLVPDTHNVWLYFLVRYNFKKRSIFLYIYIFLSRLRSRPQPSLYALG